MSRKAHKSCVRSAICIGAVPIGFTSTVDVPSMPAMIGCGHTTVPFPGGVCVVRQT